MDKDCVRSTRRPAHRFVPSSCTSKEGKIGALRNPFTARGGRTWPHRGAFRPRLSPETEIKSLSSSCVAALSHGRLLVSKDGGDTGEGVT